MGMYAGYFLSIMKATYGHGNAHALAWGYCRCGPGGVGRRGHWCGAFNREGEAVGAPGKALLLGIFCRCTAEAVHWPGLGLITLTLVMGRGKTLEAPGCLALTTENGVWPKSLSHLFCLS